MEEHSNGRYTVRNKEQGGCAPLLKSPLPPPPFLKSFKYIKTFSFCACPPRSLPMWNVVSHPLENFPKTPLKSLEICSVFYLGKWKSHLRLSLPAPKPTLNPLCTAGHQLTALLVRMPSLPKQPLPCTTQLCGLPKNPLTIHH